MTDWMYELWGKEEGCSKKEVENYIKKCISSKKIPQTIIATIDKEIVGMCNLLMHDHDSKPDIYPWLGNLFVDKDYRNQGISKMLINKAIKQSKKLNLKELYLYTKHIGLYEKFNFKFIEDIKTAKPNTANDRLYKLDLIDYHIDALWPICYN